MRINNEAYKRGFVNGFLLTKEAVENAAPDAGAEENSQQGVGSARIIEEAIKTVKPFGNKGQEAVENLADIVMKRNDLSHGPSSTTSGEGTDNYSG